MRIAQIAPLKERVPPKRYGGTERVVSYLTEELVRRGHDVTLFAAGDAITKATLVPVVPHSLTEMHILDTNPFTGLAVAKAYKHPEQFDIIHNHAYPDYLAFPAAYTCPTPTITTLHTPFNNENKQLFEEYKDLNFVSISANQRRALPGINYIKTVHNGVPIDEFPFGKNPDDYLLYVGRIAYIKGTHFAIDVAEALNKNLIIAARLETHELDYFNRFISSRLNNEKIQWVGEVTSVDRNKLMAKALCLLNPITWREPFGLTMIEAMACGTPVISFKKGASTELIVDKKTGFLVDTEKEMIKAVKKINSISRKECRDYVRKNFTLTRMVDEYEKLYDELINGKKISRKAPIIK